MILTCLVGFQNTIDIAEIKTRFVMDILLLITMIWKFGDVKLFSSYNLSKTQRNALYLMNSRILNQNNVSTLIKVLRAYFESGRSGCILRTL